jgi:hypothetical protein
LLDKTWSQLPKDIHHIPSAQNATGIAFCSLFSVQVSDRLPETWGELCRYPFS